MGWGASVDLTPMLLRPSRRQSLRHAARPFRQTLIALLLVLWPTIAFAQTDEIQVYDAEIADPGVFNLMVHNNYTFDGLKVPRFPGGLVPDHTLNGVPEWAYGVTDWFEQGLYLPLYSDASNLGPVLNGFKVRELFVVPHAAEQTFSTASISNSATTPDIGTRTCTLRKSALSSAGIWENSISSLIQSLTILGRDLTISISHRQPALLIMFQKLGPLQLRSIPISE
jgi:hypothetical protein